MYSTAKIATARTARRTHTLKWTLKIQAMAKTAKTISDVTAITCNTRETNEATDTRPSTKGEAAMPWWRRRTRLSRRDLEHALTESCEAETAAREEIHRLEDIIARAIQEREDEKISDTWQSVDVRPHQIRPGLDIGTPLGFDDPTHPTLVISAKLAELIPAAADLKCVRCGNTQKIRDRVWRPRHWRDDITGTRRLDIITVCGLCAQPVDHRWRFTITPGGPGTDRVTFTQLTYEEKPHA
jgi:hypothetical protein